MILKLILINIICILYSCIASAEYQNETILKIINKVSGKSYIQKISKNELYKFRNLSISSTHCIIDKNDDNNFAAFINIKNIKQDKYIFKGWVLSKNVGLSQVSHPIYNIKLLECL